MEGEIQRGVEVVTWGEEGFGVEPPIVEGRCCRTLHDFVVGIILGNRTSKLEGFCQSMIVLTRHSHCCLQGIISWK